MTIYQAELLRRLPQLDCTGYYGYRDGLLHIFHGDDPFCRQTPEGFLRFYEDQFEALSQTELYDKIHQEVRAIREYVGLYEAAPQMEAEGVHDYRKLAEYGNIVLAGTYNENHGFMFTTWDQDKERSYVSGGDYSPNYAYAKESFVRRSGLIQEQRLFQPEEAENLYRCVDYARNHCGSLTFEQSKALDELAEKLSFGYPEIEKNPPIFEPEDGPEKKEIKRRFQLWIRPSTLELADTLYKKDNCDSKSEFIEKAVLFYAGYLSAEDNKTYLPNIVTSTLKSIVAESDHRQNRMIFKMAVELAVMMNVVAANNNIDPVSLERLRGECVKEVKRLNGAFSFDDAVSWQNGWEEND